MSSRDEYLISMIWGDPELEARFETAPYSLSSNDLTLLAAHSKFLFLFNRLKGSRLSVLNKFHSIF